MISRVVAVPGIFHPRREIRQLISRAEIVPGIFIREDHTACHGREHAWLEEDNRKPEIQKQQSICKCLSEIPTNELH